MVSTKTLLSGLATLYLTGVSALPQPGSPSSSHWGSEPFPGWHLVHNATIATVPSNYTSPRVLYARTERIDNTLYATWENYSPEPPPVYFPIYTSTDGGQKWHHLSNVTDTKNGWGNRYQPFLYVLPQRIGAYPAGTLLLAGNSIPTDLSLTQINIYASLDKGLTWHFVSTVSNGGAAVPDNGIPAIWEPFLMVYKNQLICYYSDQRDPLYGQKLVHETTTDLLSWSGPVNDVTYDVYTARPGMTTVTHLPNGKYMMTYEYGGGPTIQNTSTYLFPVYYRINSNPLHFENSTGLPLITTDGTQPTSSPYIVWSPEGGPNGTIVVSAGCCSEIYTNKALGAEGSWVKVSTGGVRTSYSRSLRVLPDPTKLLIAGAGLLPPTNNSFVSDDVIAIH